MHYKVHLWQADYDGPGWVRVMLVEKYLNKICGNEVTASVSNEMNPSKWVIQENSGTFKSKDPFDLTIHQRQYGDLQLNYFRLLKNQLKIPCIYELDDYLHGISPLSPAFLVYNNPQTKDKLFANVHAYLTEANALTVSTDYLKRMYSKYNKNIYVLPNYIDYEIFAEEKTQKPEHGDEIWIGWAGSATHLPDLKIIVEPVSKILKEFPNTRLVLGGWDGYYRTKEGRTSYLWEKIPRERIILLKWVKDIREYPKMLAHFDIGLAPLADIVFNRCKSNIKYLEYSACGVPVIASEVEPYAKIIANGKNGLLVSTQKDKVQKAWYQAIKTLILNKELRLQLAEMGKALVKRDFDMARGIHQWNAVYKEVILKFRKDVLGEEDGKKTLLLPSSHSDHSERKEEEVTQQMVLSATENLSVHDVYQLAEKLFHDGEVAHAMAYCKRVLEIDPQYPHAFHLFGIVAAQSGNLEKAEQLILKAIDRYPQFPNYHESLANIYLLQNKPELAKRHQKLADRSGYLEWIERYDTLTESSIQQMREIIQQWSSPPLISVIMPTYNSGIRWLQSAIESVRNQIYPHWELCIADDASTVPHVRPLLQNYVNQDQRIKIVFRDVNRHISAASNSALELATGDYVALLDHDDELPIHALFFVAAEIMAHPEAMLIYSDEDKVDDRGKRSNPYFKCDWNPDLFLSHNLITHLGVYKTTLARELGGFREGFEGSQDYDLALRVTERIHSTQIRHIPHILYHWRLHAESTSANLYAKPYAIEVTEKAISEHLRRRGINATVQEAFNAPGGMRVRYALPSPPPSVSLIIPTRNQVGVLRTCVESILAKTNYDNFEIIIVDNQSDELDTLNYLKQLQKKSKIRVISYPYPFNYSAINNEAVEQAHGEIIGLLNNDLEVINENWLTEMVSHAVRLDIGAVGACLWYPNNTLQHGGVILGIQGVAGHSHKHLSRKYGGYFSRVRFIQNLSAVTGACMVLRKEVFTTVGGLNSNDLPIAFNDVDLCLKIKELLGLRIVWTPYAELYHHESVSRGYEDTVEKQLRFASEIAYMKKRWGDTLLDDPAYNPNLTLDAEDFTIAWPPKVTLNDRVPKIVAEITR